MAATSAILPAPRGDGLVTVTQRGFVIKESATPPPALNVTPPPGKVAGPLASPLSPRSKSRSAAVLGGGAEPGLLSLGASARRGGATPPLHALPSPETLDGAGPGAGSGELRLAQCATLTFGAKRLLRDVARGLKAWQEPEAATEGFGGTYFFRDEAGRCCAIMKPCDEEPLAPNNPKGFVGRKLGDPGLKPTVRVGEAATREVAAYLLDHGHFSKVPHTVMVEMSHPVFHVAAPTLEPDSCVAPSGGSLSGGGATSLLTAGLPAAGRGAISGGSGAPLSTPSRKLGSLQAFVTHDGDCSEMGASRFPVSNVHRIGILDIRLFNTDRHSGNILVRRVRRSQACGGGGGGGGSCESSGGSGGNGAPGTGLPSPPVLLDRRDWVYELVPIDHGFALPEALEPPYFEWQHWPQAMMPFGPEELEYIAGLDARADAAMLRSELPGLREESLRLLEVSTLVLQRGAAAGLSLAEIAGVLTRPLVGLDEEASELERACTAARREVELARARRASLAARVGARRDDEYDDDVDSVLGAYYDEFGEEFDEDDAGASGFDGRRIGDAGSSSPPPTSTFEALLRRHGQTGPPLFVPPDSPAPTTAASSRTLSSIEGARTPVSADGRAPRSATAAPRGVGLFTMDEEAGGSGPSGLATPVTAGSGSPLVLTPRASLVAADVSVGGARPGLLPTPADLRRLVVTQRSASTVDTGLVAAATMAGGKALPGTPVGVASSAAAATFGTPADGSVDSSGGSAGPGVGMSLGLSMGMPYTPDASLAALKPGAASCAPAVGFFDRMAGRASGAGRRRRRAPAAVRLCVTSSSTNKGATQGDGSTVDSFGDALPVGEDGEAVADVPSAAVFQGLSSAEWDHFMHALRDYVNTALRSGAWKQTPGSSGKGLPGMSCPRF